MLTKLRLVNFKSFRDAEVSLGPFTLLVGTNASGKSNVRDALRFLHGVARGYSLADIFGEKYGEGGQREWAGVRGGTREATFQGTRSFAVEIRYTVPRMPDETAAAEGEAVAPDLRAAEASYRIEVAPGGNGAPPRVVAERLVHGETYLFDSDPQGHLLVQDDPSLLRAMLNLAPPGRRATRPERVSFPSHQPIITQLLDHETFRRASHVAVHPARFVVRAALNALVSMRFLDLAPSAMRQPSVPGQVILGDRGENLPSVLQDICSDPGRKGTLLQWVQELTPADITDLEFPPDPAGRVFLTLVEGGGRKTSAYSASDGTLRFLAILAAILGAEAHPFYFFEELENGIHPTRLHLLLQLIEQRASAGAVQVAATTHSAALLSRVSRDTLENAYLTYRLEGSPETRVRRMLDIPDARRVLQGHDPGRLLSSGWFENVMQFEEGAEAAR